MSSQQTAHLPDAMNVAAPAFKWEWNLNTLAVMAGCVGGFMAWGYTLAEMRNGQVINATRITELQGSQSALAVRVDLIEKASLIQAQFDYRLAQVEKTQDLTDTRLGRITESYSNQFADMRNQLSAISTQIALTNQTLNRIEASSTPMGPGK
jgi:hypothetical protein